MFYYLPLTIVERRNYFKDEGLEVEISDFAGGAKALQAAVGGSADVVSGAFEHTLLLQAKNQYFREFVLQGPAPQIVLAVSKKAIPNYKSLADLKSQKIGVTAPGSWTSIMASFVLAKTGLKPTDVAFIGVGAGAGAIAALESGQIDAIANLDPVMTKLDRAGDIRIVSDTRTVFGGNMPAGCLYASQSFITKNPNTGAHQRDGARAQVVAGRLGQGPDRDRARKLSARRPRALSGLVAALKEAISPDGLMPEDGPATSFKMLQGFRRNDEGQADRSVEDVDQRLREESARHGQGLTDELDLDPGARAR